MNLEQFFSIYPTLEDFVTRNTALKQNIDISFEIVNGEFFWYYDRSEALNLKDRFVFPSSGKRYQIEWHSEYFYNRMQFLAGFQDVSKTVSLANFTALQKHVNHFFNQSAMNYFSCKTKDIQEVKNLGLTLVWFSSVLYQYGTSNEEDQIIIAVDHLKDEETKVSHKIYDIQERSEGLDEQQTKARFDSIVEKTKTDIIPQIVF